VSERVSWRRSRQAGARGGKSKGRKVVGGYECFDRELQVVEYGMNDLLRLTSSSLGVRSKIGAV
jgi:hypothetical protein